LPTSSIRLRRDIPRLPVRASPGNRLTGPASRRPAWTKPPPRRPKPSGRLTTFPILRPRRTFRRLSLIIDLKGYRPSFPARALLPLILAPAQSTRLRPRVHITYPLPLPPRRSRARLHPRRSLQRDHTGYRLPPLRRLFRERMQRPQSLPRVHITCRLRLPSRRSRARPRPRRSLQRDHTGYRHQLPPGQARVSRHFPNRREDRITPSPMLAPLRRQ
jgi:hypothetical protein